MDLQERINYAKKVIYGSSPLGYFTRIYPFSTENLVGYMNKFDFKGKRVLTVGSSGDQIINAHLLGASEIVCFDSQPLSIDYLKLKLIGGKLLSYEEFITFLCNHFESLYRKNKKVFNTETFELLKCYLQDTIWPTLLENYKTKRIYNNLFIEEETTLEVLKQTNLYMNEEGYKLFKSKISTLSPTFINEDLLNIHDHLSGKFDFILLSNISNFIRGLYDNPLADFKKTLQTLKSFLNDEGVIFFAYLYDMNESTKTKKNWPIIYDLNTISKYFKDENFEKITFKGVNSFLKNDDKISDMVLTLRK